MRTLIGAVSSARVAAAFVLGPSLLFRRTLSSASSQQHKFIASQGDGNGGDGIVMTPSSGDYDSVVIFMHGLGDTAMGWAPYMPELGLTTTKFVLPTAPSRPIALNGGMPMPGWFDIFGLEESSREDKAGFAESAQRITALIEQESLNVPLSRIAVCGFSQGGAMALHVSLRFSGGPSCDADSSSSSSKTGLAACAALSAWLPLRNDYPNALSDKALDLPVLMCHGDSDEVVPPRWGRGSFESLVRPQGDDTTSGQELSLGLRNAEWKEYSGLGHSASEAELSDVSAFLRAALAPPSA